jgi:indole-3-glycerol phosphate synthase
MNILQRIVETKRAELGRMSEAPPARLVSRPSFVEAIRRNRPAFIAEVKPKSPSAGALLSADRVPEIVAVYDRLATAISVLCDEVYFGGGYDLLARVASLTGKPLLAKEFILDRRQIALAAAHGASAVLLIAAILGPRELEWLIRYAVELGCDVLLELHDVEDVAKAAIAIEALAAGPARGRIVLGINNRNLDTLAIDLRQTEQLAPFVRERLGGDLPLIAESGIDSPEACRRLISCVGGFLVGTSLLRSPDPADFLCSLTSSCDHS